MPKTKVLSKSFTQRLLSALAALLLLFITFYFFKTTGLYILSSVVVLVMSYEVFNLCLKPSKPLFFVFFISRSLWFFSFLKFINLNFLWLFVFADIFIWLLFERFSDLKNKENLIDEKRPKNTQENILSFIFYSLVTPTLCLSHLKMTEHGALALFTLLFVVLCFDSFSYFCGKAFGGVFFKSKLYPKASPSKTVEGALGGLISTSIFILLIKKFNLFAMPQFDALLPNNSLILFSLVVIFCVFSLCGDLLESLLKRSAGVKDSGSIMPGHGGIFDRLDGVLMASVFSYFLLTL